MNSGIPYSVDKKLTDLPSDQCSNLLNATALYHFLIYTRDVGETIARKISVMVITPLISALISDTAVIGFLLRLIRGCNRAANTPRIIVIRYFGYLATFAKKSPIVIVKSGNDCYPVFTVKH